MATSGDVSLVEVAESFLSACARESCLGFRGARCRKRAKMVCAQMPRHLITSLRVPLETSQVKLQCLVSSLCIRWWKPRSLKCSMVYDNSEVSIESRNFEPPSTLHFSFLKLCPWPFGFMLLCTMFWIKTCYLNPQRNPVTELRILGGLRIWSDNFFCT